MKNKFLIIVSSILATLIVLVTTLIGIFYLSSNILNSVTFLKKILPNNFKGLVKKKYVNMNTTFQNLKMKKFFP